MKAAEAKTGRKVKHIVNPADAIAEAEDMVERFHGRKPKGILEITEVEEYDDTLPVMAQLLELNVMCPNGKSYVPIEFCRMRGNVPRITLDSMIQVCHTLDNQNIVFKGGDQSLNLELLGSYLKEQFDTKHGLVVVGPVFSIVYFTDKHHLEGPKSQAKGAVYEHEFGERADEGEDGEQPSLVYDPKNKKIMLSGGSYEIRAEGIWN